MYGHSATSKAMLSAAFARSTSPAFAGPPPAVPIRPAPPFAPDPDEDQPRRWPSYFDPDAPLLGAAIPIEDRSPFRVGENAGFLGTPRVAPSVYDDGSQADWYDGYDSGRHSSPWLDREGGL